MVHANFPKSMYFNWGAHHSSILGNGDDLRLVLDQTSGSGIQSKRAFLFGSIEMLIKLVPGEPYTVHTNVYTQGQGNREQQFKLWFDPTSNYHNYTIHWNPTEVVWYVDSVPIRVFRNYESEGIAYPNQQGMRVYSSLWNADNWATRGGLVKIDWTSAPFVANYRRFRARACKWNGPVSISQCAIPTRGNWWTAPAYQRLSYSQQGQLKWALEAPPDPDESRRVRSWALPALSNKELWLNKWAIVRRGAAGSTTIAARSTVSMSCSF
ncbi:hypothetical protein L1987_50114 [Smallanthus sonchifolius]|uniref:Uncharacterized protein n=1 Tax=Smallanthus sonchifolius TaxID=185202 RepID=A0ACB9FXK9_9ASTR|nr:hypothetical protein L1987_50114 [Smallanthus sonchifolius]